MLLDQFSLRFPDEDACIAYFREVRTFQGVVCTQCGKTTHKWVKGKNAFQCESCGCSGANPKSLGYNEFAEIAHQLIKPLPSIFKEVQVLSIDWIKKESERIKSQLEEE